MGEIEKVSAQESDAYFNSRPKGSQLGAWTSPQSQIIENREELNSRLESMEKRFSTEPISRPPHWGGYRLLPIRVEFWQGRPSRLHDRICYQKQAKGNWDIFRLAP